MQTLTFRALRFVTDRYAQRERPSVAAEFTALALIVATAIWPLLSMVQALRLIR